MTKSFRFHAKCTTYYTNTYEAETKEEAERIAQEKLLDGTWEELSSDDPVIFDSYRNEDSDDDEEEN